MGLYNDLQFNSGQYIPQYAGAPLAEIEKTADTLAGRHYQNINEMSAIQIALAQAKSQLGEGMRPYLDQQAAEIETSLQEMAKSGAENAGPKVNEIARRLKGDEKLMRMLNYSKAVQADKEAGAAMALKSGKNPVYKSDFYDFNKMTADDERLMRGYNPSAAMELDITEDMKRIVDEVPPDKWQAIGVTGERLDKFKKDLKSDPRAAMDGLLKSVDIESNKQKLIDLEKELLSAFKETPSYKQKVDYGISDEATLASKLKDFTKLNMYTKEDVNVVQDQRLDQALKRAQLALAQPATPYVYDNASALVDISPEEWTKQEATVRDLKVLRDNKAKNGASKEELDEIDSRIQFADEQLAATRKVVEKEVDLSAGWKELQSALNKEYTDFKGKHTEAQRKAIQKNYGIPQTEQEFMTAVRSGQTAAEQGGYGSTVLNKYVRLYKNKTQTVHEDLKVAKNYPIYSDTGNPNMQAIHAQWGDLWQTNSGFTDPVTGEQINPETVTNKIGAVEIDGVKYVHDSKNDKIQMTGGLIGGKPIMHVTPALKPVNAGEGSVTTFGKSFTVTPDNTKEGLRAMIDLGLSMTNPGNKADRWRLIGQGTFAPIFAAQKLEYADGERKLGEIGGNILYIVPNGKDPATNKNNSYTIKTSDGTILDQNLRDLAEVSTALGSYLEQANQK